MNAIFNFLDTWGIRVVTILSIIIFLKTCNTNSKIDGVVKDLNKTNQKMDSSFNVLKEDISIEGLKTEKRLIQSTDRKILDINRQSEIDKEIEKRLNKK